MSSVLLSQSQLVYADSVLSDLDIVAANEALDLYALDLSMKLGFTDVAFNGGEDDFFVV